MNDVEWEAATVSNSAVWPRFEGAGQCRIGNVIAEVIATVSRGLDIPGDNERADFTVPCRTARTFNG